MEIETKPDSFPGYCMQGLQILNDKKDKKFNMLTVGELEKLVKFWLYQVIQSLEKPVELKALYHTKKEVMQLLNISQPKLDELIKSGALPVRKLGRRTIIMSEDLKQTIKGL